MTESNTSVYRSKCSNPTSAMYKAVVTQYTTYFVEKAFREDYRAMLIVSGKNDQFGSKF